jgi:hypothetical protein
MSYRPIAGKALTKVKKTCKFCHIRHIECIQDESVSTKDTTMILYLPIECFLVALVNIRVDLSLVNGHSALFAS